MAKKGAVVTIDVMGCQREICQQIIDREGDYVIGLKGDQGSLRVDVELFFDKCFERDIGGDFVKQGQTVDGDQGRVRA